ncbi:hypothetical protein D5S17_23365 [Pseudonocardiaceae bacterium YIM PH 21723]|nr:hypothetical protein D5S17_23365 [Pseudonocardiaceae bacterium YIM PH 21723]
MTATQETKYPYRIADQLNQGWLTQGDGTYHGFDPSAISEKKLLDARPLSEIERDFGPWRPVVPMPDSDQDALYTAFALAGRKTVTSVASALDQVFHEVRRRFVAEHGEEGFEDYGYAVRTLTAGRPGSWEAASLIDLVPFGNELNLHPRKADSSASEMRETGPNLKRVHLEARDAIAAVLRQWTSSGDFYVEVAETLASVVSRYADEKYGADGWKAIADQWLQPGGLAKENFHYCYKLLYSTSEYMDTRHLG